MENTQTTTVTLIKDGDDVLLPLPTETLQGMNLQTGDYIKFTIIEDGAVQMTKWDGQLDLFDDVTKMISKVVDMEEQNG